MGARYGQHFLRDARAISAILRRFDPRPEDAVVEIGPGRGALTEPLVSRVGALAAIEVDAALARSVAERLGAPLLELDALPARESLTAAGSSPRVVVLRGDALDARYEALARLLGAAHDPPAGTERRERDAALCPPPSLPGSGPEPAIVSEADARGRVRDRGRRLRVIGNLPYAIATALIQRMIAARAVISDATIMVQEEVADRLLASPGSRDYGYLSVLLSLSAARERVLRLGPGAFSPPPKVRSTVVALRFAPPPAGGAAMDARLAEVLRAAFSERRKKAASNLARRFAMERAEIREILASCGADPEARAEAIAPEMFARLAASLPSPPPVHERGGPSKDRSQKVPRSRKTEL